MGAHHFDPPRRAAFLATLALLACCAEALAAPADDVRALYESGKAREAYALGKGQPGELGRPAFDYWFGLAAVDAGHPGEGVLALERFLLNEPRDVNAKLELGRAYFALGDDMRSRQMFEEVNRLGPPPAVRARMERFLALIAEREGARRPSTAGYLEAGAGYDSNVNSGISGDLVNVPIFGDVAIDAAGRRDGSQQALLAGGIEHRRPLAPEWSAFASAAGEARTNRRAHEFDQSAATASAGLAWKQGDRLVRGSLGASALWVDAARYRTLGAATLEGQWAWGRDAALSAYAQRAAIRYEGDNAVRDATLDAAGIGWRYAPKEAWQPLVALGAFLGREDNRHDRDDLGRDLGGARASLALTPAEGWGLVAGVTWQRSRYGADDPLFDARRVDRYLLGEAGIARALPGGFVLRLDVSRAVNRSTIALYRYDRNQVALKLRHDWK